ncbi:Splicing factor [Malassezia sp. CBS 17886]|nr:Splicing factor [Malassezia sp. CBS 17886]
MSDDAPVAMDVDAGATSAGAADVASTETLDPWRYASWVRSLERKLLAAGEDERAALAPSLSAAYAETADKIALCSADWHIWLSLALCECVAASPAASVGGLVALHRRSTEDLLDMSLYARYATLLLALYSAASGVCAGGMDAVYRERLVSDSGAPSDVTALLSSWTGLPEAAPLHANGTYAVDAPIWRTAVGAAAQGDADAACDIAQESNIRSALRELYGRCAWHPTESEAVWRTYLAFEEAALEVRIPRLCAPVAHLQHDASTEHIDLVRQVYVARLQVPHRDLERTFQALSSFVSARYGPEEYESIMAAANKHYAASMGMWQERESFEARIAAAESTYMDDWLPYIGWQTHRLKSLRVARDKTTLATEEECAATLYRRALFRFGQFPRARSAAEAAAYAAQPPTAAVEKAHKARAGRKSHKMLLRENALAYVEIRPQVAASESLWLDYVAVLNTPKADPVLLVAVCRSAVRTLPSAGRLWALYLRTIARAQRPHAEVVDAYDRALGSGTVAAVGGSAALAPLLQARVDCERAHAVLEAALQEQTAPEDIVLVADFDRFMHIYELLMQALGTLAAVPESDRDQSLVLEKYTSDWIERAARAIAAAAGADAAAGLYPLADDLWENVLTQHTLNAVAYQSAALYFARRDDDRRARQIFRAGASKHMENKSELLQTWLQFEHERGALADIDHAETRAKAEQDRVWRAWYRATAQSGAAVQPRAHSEHGDAPAAGERDRAVDPGDREVPAAQHSRGALLPETPTAHDPAAGATAAPGDTDPLRVRAKRKADAQDACTTHAHADAAADPTKKSRADAAQPPARDREFSSITIAGLPGDATADDLRAFFRDCGEVHGITGPRATGETSESGEGTAAALVEFEERDAAAAARTRDLKRIRGCEVHVAPSYQCTLYVTNFPPDADDAAMRAFFGKYGAIFDVRWPSRKFVQSRRFCYVQFVTAAYAQAALAAHGAHWFEEHPLQVLLSNPSHRKQRSDANANEKELYMTGLPRSATVEDVRAFFQAHATPTDVRMPPRPDGKSRGIAFVNFATPLDARRAMQATNSTEFKGRLVAVMLADAGRSRSGHASAQGDHAPSGGAETQASGAAVDRDARTVRVAGLPADAQEPLIQQAMEQALGPDSVRRVFWTPSRHGRSSGTPGAPPSADSLVEMQDAEVRSRAARSSLRQTAGRAILGATATYAGTYPLTVTEYAPVRVSGAAAGLVPRSHHPPRRGRGAAFAPRPRPVQQPVSRGAGQPSGGPPQRDAPQTVAPVDASGDTPGRKGQDQFRAMLRGGKGGG